MKLKVLNMNYVYDGTGQRLIPGVHQSDRPWHVFGGPRLIRKFRTHRKALRYALKAGRKKAKK